MKKRGMKRSKSNAKRPSRKWIQSTHLHKGALHKQLGIPLDEKIPVSLLKEAANESGKLGHRARLALTLRGLRKR